MEPDGPGRKCVSVKPAELNVPKDCWFTESSPLAHKLKGQAILPAAAAAVSEQCRNPPLIYTAFKEVETEEPPSPPSPPPPQLDSCPSDYPIAYWVSNTACCKESSWSGGKCAGNRGTEGRDFVWCDSALKSSGPGCQNYDENSPGGRPAQPFLALEEVRSKVNSADPLEAFLCTEQHGSMGSTTTKRFLYHNHLSPREFSTTTKRLVVALNDWEDKAATESSRL